MRFEQALQALREGKSVKRTNPRLNDVCLINHPPFGISFYRPKTQQIIWLGDGCESDYYLNSDDLLAEDWEIVDEWLHKIISQNNVSYPSI